jgi:hypothetical protein
MAVIGDGRLGMRPLDAGVRDAFLEGARRRRVSAGEVWDYVKWLRYYLDFCEKYRHEALDRESLQEFLLKLASRNQSAEQQAQAARSVRLYIELAAPRPAAPVASAQDAPPSTVVPRAAAPAPAPTVTATPPGIAPTPSWPVGTASTFGAGTRPDRVAERASPWPGSSP